MSALAELFRQDLALDPHDRCTGDCSDCCAAFARFVAGAEVAICRSKNKHEGTPKGFVRASDRVRQFFMCNIECPDLGSIAFRSGGFLGINSKIKLSVCFYKESPDWRKLDGDTQRRVEAALDTHRHKTVYGVSSLLRMMMTPEADAVDTIFRFARRARAMSNLSICRQVAGLSFYALRNVCQQRHSIALLPESFVEFVMRVNPHVKYLQRMIRLQLFHKRAKRMFRKNGNKPSYEATVFTYYGWTLATERDLENLTQFRRILWSRSIRPKLIRQLNFFKIRAMRFISARFRRVLAVKRMSNIIANAPLNEYTLKIMDMNDRFEHLKRHAAKPSGPLRGALAKRIKCRAYRVDQNIANRRMEACGAPEHA